MESLVARTAIKGLADGTQTASSAATAVAQYTQLAYGPSAVSAAWRQRVKIPDEGQFELLRVLETVLCAGAAALVDAKIEGFAAARGALSERDVAEPQVRMDSARRLGTTAELAKRAAADRVAGAAIRIQAGVRARPARRLRAYARLAALTAVVTRRQEAATRH